MRRPQAEPHPSSPDILSGGIAAERGRSAPRADLSVNFVLMHNRTEFAIDEPGARKTGFVLWRCQLGNFVDRRINELHFRNAERNRPVGR